MDLGGDERRVRRDGGIPGGAARANATSRRAQWAGTVSAAARRRSPGDVRSVAARTSRAYRAQVNLPPGEGPQAPVANVESWRSTLRERQSGHSRSRSESDMRRS